MENKYHQTREDLSTSLGYTEEVRNSLTISKPNLELIRHDRQERVNKIMKAKLSLEASAAIKIQSYFRGMLARREYLKRLIQKMEEEAEKMERKRMAQVEEGEMLIENIYSQGNKFAILIISYRLRAEFEDNKAVRRNKKRLYETQVTRIQRAWRGFKRRQSQASLADEEVNQEEKPIEDDKNENSNMPSKIAELVAEDVSDYSVTTNIEEQVFNGGQPKSEMDVIAILLSEIINKAIDNETESQTESHTISRDHHSKINEHKAVFDDDKLDISSDEKIQLNATPLPNDSNLSNKDIQSEAGLNIESIQKSFGDGYKPLLNYSNDDLSEKKVKLENLIQDTSKSLILLLVEQDELKSANVALTTHVEELTR
ncbi:uncharacterized protein TRIADDRAFT_60189 [Trichoplax adhaerens]|uniref:Uncharacterized protein n=1 Tax=Trichoplax adhaerens TaxID=10228 RepID=B3S7J6_TRIAD|nr:hypothetical protein TRIADDRAFT_60189 [Trichoplax adhaerens]EDV21209.1 hypothetical protein TRIADDRAFT_60189 [Trichoplax adhaerens]|eukprot:XP_002116176.1 hypothetical protein TRIADDRAFT_60189 [Trichoplax adhaerens]